MKAIVLLATVLFAAVFSATAQVSLDLDLEQRQFLRNEVIPVYIRITNRSGQPLKIGEGSDWLTFTVETRDGKLVSPVQDILAGGNFELESAATITKIIDIGVGYDLGQQGGYKVTASARFSQLKLTVTSNTEVFNIVNGARLWEEVCGVPQTNGAPQWIKFSLLQANATKQLRLYVRVADEPEGVFVKVQPIGPIVSFSKTEQIIDRKSRLHVLYQGGPRVVEYCEVSPKGEVLGRQSYDLQPTRPHLKMSEDGKVTVMGGLLKPISPFVPQPKSGLSTNATPASK